MSGLLFSFNVQTYRTIPVIYRGYMSVGIIYSSHYHKRIIMENIMFASDRLEQVSSLISIPH